MALFSLTHPNESFYTLEKLFSSLPSKRRKHLSTIHNEMMDFLSYYGKEFSPIEQEALLFSSKYHDLGYHQDLLYTNNHGLDLVLYLEKHHAVTRLVALLILFHTMTDEELNNQEVINLKETITKREQFLIDVLTYFDLHTNLKGELISLESRLNSVKRRKKISLAFKNYAYKVRDEILTFLMNNHHKALVFDVDNTLSFDNAFSNENITALQAFQSKGYEIIFNTGKLPHALFDAEKQIGFTVHKVCLNGNIISDNNNNLKIIKDINQYQNDFSKTLVHNNIEYIAYTKNGVIENNTLSEINRQKIKDVGDYIVDFDKTNKLIKIICFITKEQTQAKKIIDQYIVNKDLKAIRTSEYFYEIVPASTNKGTGLKQVLKENNIFHRSTYVFGDNYNDISMFELGGKSFVLNHAPKYVKYRGYERIQESSKTIAVSKKLKEL